MHHVVEDGALAHRVGAIARPDADFELGDAAIGFYVERPGWVRASA
jgi:hypothetical protein